MLIMISGNAIIFIQECCFLASSSWLPITSPISMKYFAIPAHSCETDIYVSVMMIHNDLFHNK